MTVNLKVVLFLILLSMTVVTSYLSYSFYGKYKVANDKVSELVRINKDLNASLSKKDKVITITDEVISEYINEKGISGGAERDDLNDLTLMKATPQGTDIKHKTQAVERVIMKERINEIVDIDDKLPDDLRLLIKRSCDRAEGNSC